MPDRKRHTPEFVRAKRNAIRATRPATIERWMLAAVEARRRELGYATPGRPAPADTDGAMDEGARMTPEPVPATAEQRAAATEKLHALGWRADGEGRAG